MIKFVYIIRILSFLGLILSGCSSNYKKDNKFDLTEQVWIYDSQSMPDSIKDFTDNFLIFDSTKVHMNYESLGEYTIKNDTLRIFQTSYVLQKGGKYQKRVNDQFLGIIIKMDSAQILIKSIHGYFPIKYKMSYGKFDESKLIRLTNQKCKKRKQIDFKYISIASSSCYGTCPEYNIELYKNGFFKFHCSSHCKNIGYYKGKLNANDLRKIEDFISYLNLKNDSTIFSTPIDAPEAVVKLNVNNREYYFYGYPGEFQNKMFDMMQELLAMTEKADMKKTDSKLQFKATLKVPPVEKTIQFLPPNVE